MRTSAYIIEIHGNRFSQFFTVSQFLNFENRSIFSKVKAILSFKDFCKSWYPLWHFELQGLYLARYSLRKKTLFKIHIHKEYRVYWTEISYFVWLNAYSRSDALCTKGLLETNFYVFYVFLSLRITLAEMIPFSLSCGLYPNKV